MLQISIMRKRSLRDPSTKKCKPYKLALIFCQKGTNLSSHKSEEICCVWISPAADSNLTHFTFVDGSGHT